MIVWNKCYSRSGSVTSDYISPITGKFYMKTVTDYFGTTIERFPSYEYLERNNLGLNKGCRILEVTARG